MKCPVCHAKVYKPMEDEWAECSCGWSALMDDEQVANLKATKE